jgi:hypothetical protein
MLRKMTIADAAFYGFGLIRRDPATFWGAALLTAGFAVSLGFLASPIFDAMEATANGDDPTLVASDASALLGWAPLLAIPFSMAVTGALNRSLVLGASRGWVLGLKFGMDEVRVLVVTIVGCFMALLPYVGMVLVSGALLWGAVAMQGAAAMAVSLMPLVLIPTYIGALCLMTWVGVRLSLAAPASVGEGRFVIFESWKMTKGRFWTLFVGYLLFFVIAFVAWLLIAVIVTAAGVALDATFPGAFYGPRVVIVMAGYSLVATLLGAGFCGVAARGYRDWKGASGDSIAEVF